MFDELLDVLGLHLKEEELLDEEIECIDPTKNPSA